MDAKFFRAVCAKRAALSPGAISQGVRPDDTFQFAKAATLPKRQPVIRSGRRISAFDDRQETELLVRQIDQLRWHSFILGRKPASLRAGTEGRGVGETFRRHELRRRFPVFAGLTYCKNSCVCSLARSPGCKPAKQACVFTHIARGRKTLSQVKAEAQRSGAGMSRSGARMSRHGGGVSGREFI